MARPQLRSVRRVRFAPIAVAAAVLSSALLGLSTTGTLSAFTASITNSSNTAASGSLVMKETDSTGATSCLSTAGSCGTIDKYGGTAAVLTPGSTAHQTTVRFYNLGTTAANTFVLAPGTCQKTGSTTGDLCTQLKLTLTCAPVTGGTPGTAVTLYNAVALSALGTSKNIGTASASCIPPMSSTNYVQFSFSVQLDQNADDTVQGQQVTQPLTWTYTGA